MSDLWTILNVRFANMNCGVNVNIPLYIRMRNHRPMMFSYYIFPEEIQEEFIT